jgi:hypothetical protein
MGCTFVEWVARRHGCHQTEQLTLNGFLQPAVAVNVSPVVLTHTDVDPRTLWTSMPSTAGSPSQGPIDMVPAGHRAAPCQLDARCLADSAVLRISSRTVGGGTEFLANLSPHSMSPSLVLRHCCASLQ